MVDTGIFTVPGHVLEATGSKKISIVFFEESSLTRRAGFGVAGLLLLLELKAKQRKDKDIDGPSWTS